MTQAERRHDRLAVRLSLIISRLLAGETLDLRTLASEFGVSIRTLRRDFRERLMYLDLEYRKGQCRLLSGNRQLELAVMTFNLNCTTNPDAQNVLQHNVLIDLPNGNRVDSRDEQTSITVVMDDQHLPIPKGEIA